MIQNIILCKSRRYRKMSVFFCDDDKEYDICFRSGKITWR